MCRWFDSASRHHHLKGKFGCVRFKNEANCTFILCSICFSFHGFAAGDKPSSQDISTQSFSEDDQLVLDEPSQAQLNNSNDDHGLDEDLLSTYLPFTVDEQFVYDEVPDQYKDFVDVSIVNDEPIVITNTVALEGFSYLGGSVFINGRQIITDQEGHFVTDVSLGSNGKQSLLVVFTTPDNRYFALRKKVLYLVQPKGLMDVVENRQVYSYFFNTKLIHDAENKSLFDGVTRADLAYFLYQLNDEVQIEVSDLEPLDVTKNSWIVDSVDYVLANQLMGMYPDQRFYPERQVTRIELVTTLVRAMDYAFDEGYMPLGYDDLKDTHWSSKYVRVALRESLIDESRSFNMDQIITFKSFIDMVDRLGPIQYEMSLLDDFTEGFDLDSALVASAFEPPYYQVLEQLETMESLQKFEILEPLSGAVLFQDHVTINGKIFPPTEFVFGDDRYSPDVMGDFSFSVTLNQGTNVFFTEAFEVSANYLLTQLDGYDDLTDHWFNITASQLRFMELLEDTPTFNPKQTITRLDFVDYTSRFFELTVTDNEWDIVPQDVSSDDPYFNRVCYLLDSGIFMLDDEDGFYPNSELTRLEAVSALVRYVQLFYPESLSEPLNDFPYWDISKQHEGRLFVESAYQMALISEAHNFYPDTIITKDQFVAMLSKSYPVQDRINTVFYD